MPLHLVNVWAAESRLVIGQRLAPGRNEVLGAQQALALLSLPGCIVTADALGPVRISVREAVIVIR